MRHPTIPLAALMLVSLAACRASTTADAVTEETADTGAEERNAEETKPQETHASGLDTEGTAPFSLIRKDETVRFTGTEPFWGGQVTGTALTYSTPEDIEGTDIAVTRFAGRGGVSWSGTYQGARFALAVTPAECSDGMSDRTYPFAATLEVGGEQRQGCAWTERQPFDGPAQP